MELNQECTLLQNELRRFANQVLLPTVDERDKSGRVSSDILKKLAEMGMLGAVIPEKLGGVALTTMGFVVSLEEISKVCASTGLIAAVHNACFAYPLVTFGTQMQHTKYLPLAATGNSIGGFAPPQTNDLQVEYRSDSIRINGENSFVLNGHTNGPFLIVLPDEEHLSAFVVDANLPGIERRNQDTLGMKAAGIGAVVFKDCVLSREACVGGEHHGHDVLDALHDIARIHCAAIACGIAQAATDAATKYAKERVQFNEHIIRFGMVREKLAEMVTLIEASRLLTYNAAQTCDHGTGFKSSASMAKSFAGHAAVRITTSAIQIYGGYGYMRDYPVERHFRDAQVINVVCGTTREAKERIVKDTTE